jgi:hypothetical protein
MTSNMSRLTAVGALLAAALLPLAAAAASNRQTVETTTERAQPRIATSARHMVKGMQRARIITVDETRITAKMRTAAERETAAIAVEECPAWRLLATDAHSRAWEPSRVRTCEVPVRDDERGSAAAEPHESLTTRSVVVFHHGPTE